VLVETAVAHLDDPSEFMELRTWYRNGSRGSLHSTRSCYKHDSYRSDNTVELSTVDAVKKRTCGSCLDDLRFLNMNVDMLLKTLTSVDRELRAARESISGTRIRELGSTLTHLKDAKANLARLSEEQTDLISRRLGELENEITEIQAQADRSVEDRRTGIVPWAASRLCMAQASETRYQGVEVPGASAEDIVVFGGTPDDEHNIEHQLLRIYQRWCMRREKGEDAARERAIALLKECRLGSIAQLEFVSSKGAAEGSLLHVALEAWREDIRKRLTEKLLVKWEASYRAYATMTEPRTIGVSHDPPIREETAGIYAAYPHARVASGGMVAVVPEVVARWIHVHEVGRWNTSPTSISRACNIDALETVAALWDPHSRESEYRDLERTIDTAELL
jgi:hypothetical protein